MTFLDNQDERHLETQYPCPAQYGGVYNDWVFADGVDCSCIQTDVNENGEANRVHLHCTSCLLCNTPDICYTLSLAAQVNLISDRYESIACIDSDATGYEGELCVAVRGSTIDPGFSNGQCNARLDGALCGTCELQTCEGGGRGLLVDCSDVTGRPSSAWDTCTGENPNIQHPWIPPLGGIVPDLDPSNPIYYPPWGNGTCADSGAVASTKTIVAAAVAVVGTVVAMIMQ